MVAGTYAAHRSVPGNTARAGKGRSGGIPLPMLALLRETNSRTSLRQPPPEKWPACIPRLPGSTFQITSAFPSTRDVAAHVARCAQNQQRIRMLVPCSVASCIHPSACPAPGNGSAPPGHLFRSGASDTANGILRKSLKSSRCPPVWTKSRAGPHARLRTADPFISRDRKNFPSAIPRFPRLRVRDRIRPRSWSDTRESILASRSDIRASTPRRAVFVARF